MNNAMRMGILRHVLTIIGSLLVARGYTDASTMEVVVGSATALGATAWSMADKKKR